MKRFRPFEALKLIRDNKTNVDTFFVGFTNPENHRFRSFISGLQSLGFINIDEGGEIIPTDKLQTFLNAFDLSLTQLETYSPNSMVFSPIFGLPAKEFEKADIFMVMPFQEKLKPVYKDHIQTVADKLNLSIARGDDFFTSSSIISDIWNAINSCKLIIADCTDRNPNVFYEIGIAHTIGKPVIFISQNKEDIPFDVQHIRYIIYNYTPKGMTEFEDTLSKTLRREISKIRIDDYVKKSPEEDE